jgi:hypothetical protein
MMTRSGRQYIPPSTTMASTNPVIPVSSPNWSHKEIFGSLELANTPGGLHDLPSKVDSWIPRFSGEKGSVAVLIHTCKRELSPAHLVCPQRHNA